MQISPVQQVVKIVHEEMTNILGGNSSSLINRNAPPTVIMLVGLQGAGKTTTAAKLALHLKDKGHPPLLIAADLQRPAAIEQLQTLGNRLGIETYSESGNDSTTIGVATNGLTRARQLGSTWVIIDTAGRLHIDPTMMSELIEIKNSVSPVEIIMVVDSMTGQDAVQAGLVGLSFSTSPSVAWYVPVGHLEGEQLPMEEVLAAVRPLFESPDIRKCAHNANYDMTILASHGIDCQGVDFDTMVAAHLLNRGQLGLKNLALDVLGQEMTPISELIGSGRKQISFDQVDIMKAAPYAAADADMTGRLRLAFEEPVVREAMSSLMTDMEMPLVPVLVTMQRHGIKLDSAALREMSEDLKEQMFRTEEELYKSIGHAVNINSPQQLSDLLFNEIGLPKTKRTKTGYSTDANSLEALKGLHPVVDQLLEYRQVSKLKSTYVDALPDMVNPVTVSYTHLTLPTKA